MMQNSVYIKHLRSDASIDSEERFIDAIAPKNGHLAVLRLTKAQFHSMSVVRGDSSRTEKFTVPVLYF